MQFNISKEEYIERVNHNIDVYKTQALNGSFDPSEYHLATHKKKELAIPILLQNMHDIYASAILGALAVPSVSGTDAIFMEDGVLKNIELKTSYINTSSMTKKNNKLYIGTNRKVLVTAHLRATFTISKNVQLQNVIDTYFMCIDGTTGNIISAHMMDSNTTHDFLVKQNCTKRAISLHHFIKYGKEIQLPIPTTGFQHWYESTLKEVQEQ